MSKQWHAITRWVNSPPQAIFLDSKIYLWGFLKQKWVPQTKFWGPGHWYNFNVFAISTFWKLGVHHNFNGSAISTFVIFWNYDNFNVTQFQRARAARPGKNTLQFRQVCNFYVLNTCKMWQFQRCNNFYVLENIVSLQFQRASNFYVWHLLRVQQFRCHTISILDLEVSLPKMLTISTMPAILTHF